MTIYLIDQNASACDSLWTNGNGEPVQCEIEKYLYLPNEGDIEGVQGGFLIKYSGHIEPILLDQAFRLGQITQDQYTAWLGNIKLCYTKATLSYTQLIIPDWNIGEAEGYSKCSQTDVMGSGTGYSVAEREYRICYDVVKAVNSAASEDPYSGPPVRSLKKVLKDHRPTIINNGFEDVDLSTFNRIADLTEKMILDLQNRGGSKMDDFKYAGYKTSPEPEAKELDICSLKEKAKKYAARNANYRARTQGKSSPKIKARTLNI